MFRTFVAATVLGMIAMAPVAAADPFERNAIKVSYADLNLSSEAGAKSLLARIKTASKQVCGPRPSSRDVRQSFHYQACYQDSLSQAVAAIDSPVLSAMLDGQTQNRQVATR